jgi:hypothetical protein
MHYRNGRKAQVGDPVVGKTYNTGGAVISGTLISLTPGPDACSCEVGYLAVQPAEAREDRPVRLAGSEQHGASGARVVIGYRSDYSQCNNLLHAEDALAVEETTRLETLQLVKEARAAGPEGPY